MADRRPDSTRPENISTEHQKDGDAGLPNDTLNRPADQVHPPRDFNPADDVGHPEPKGS